MEDKAAALVRLIIEVAGVKGDSELAALKAALPRATLFVKVVGVGGAARHGDRVVAGPSQPLQMGMVRLPNGLKMLFASVVPPRQVAAGETIATLQGADLCRMLVKTDADGLLVSAEDTRRSWVGLKRDEIVVMLDALQAAP